MRAQFKAWRERIVMARWAMAWNSGSTMSDVFPAEVQEHIISYLLPVEQPCRNCGRYLWLTLDMRMTLEQMVALMPDAYCQLADRSAVRISALSRTGLPRVQAPHGELAHYTRYLQGGCHERNSGFTVYGNHDLFTPFLGPPPRAAARNLPRAYVGYADTDSVTIDQTVEDLVMTANWEWNTERVMDWRGDEIHVNWDNWNAPPEPAGQLDFAALYPSMAPTPAALRAHFVREERERARRERDQYSGGGGGGKGRRKK